MNKFASRAGSAGLIALCALSLSTPAFARDDIVVSYADNGAVTRSVPVQVADLQLGTVDGRTQLDSRIMKAAKVACAYESVYGLAGPRDYNLCYAHAKRNARAQVAALQTASR